MLIIAQIAGKFLPRAFKVNCAAMIPVKTAMNIKSTGLIVMSFIVNRVISGARLQTYAVITIPLNLGAFLHAESQQLRQIR